MRLSIFSFCMIAVLAFSACGKEGFKKDYDKEDYEKDDYDKEDYDKESCFELVDPITYLMPDDTEITGGNEEVEIAIKAWYEANPDSEEKPELQYPVDVVFGDEETETIADEAAMIQLKKDCEEDEMEVCEWDGSEVADETVWEEYVTEPLETGEECDCIVSGQVKYVKIGTDFAYEVYYGKGECDQWAYLVTYKEDGKVYKCKFQMDCEDGN